MLEVMMFSVLGTLVLMIAGFLFYTAAEDLDLYDFKSVFVAAFVFLCGVLVAGMGMTCFDHVKTLLSL